MIPNPYPGIFIVFEGIDGCGKTSQLNRVCSWMQTLEALRHHNISKQKEPGKERTFGKKIYADLYDKSPHALHKTNPQSFQTWYACDSKENLRLNIIPELMVGSIVLCDRFRPSMVYGAEGYGDISTLMTMNQEILGEDFIWPDLILVFDLPVMTALSRLKEKNRNLDEHERQPILAKVRHNYVHFAGVYRNCKIIDSDQSEEVVFGIVKKLLLSVLKSRKFLVT